MAENKEVKIKLGEAWRFEGNLYLEGMVVSVPRDIYDSLVGAKVKVELIEDKKEK